jgi:adenylylsulfate kinase
VSPYRAARDEARALLGEFVEVYVDCPTSECERRDVKGMYRRARAGELKGFTGVDDPYEAPLDPEIVLLTDQQSSEQSVANLEQALLGAGRLSADDPNLGDTPEIERRFAELLVWR